MESRPLTQRILPSPIGPLRLVANDQAVHGLYFAEHPGAPPSFPSTKGRHAVIDAAVQQLREYFTGARQVFSVPLHAAGTDFQRSVWAALATIPFGTHWSYASLAQRLGRPRAVRAVASANARNPLSLFVPCHRVIGSDGRLTGYAGGLDAKRWLLHHEQSVASPAAAPAPEVGC